MFDSDLRKDTDSFSRGEESPGASLDAQKMSKYQERKDDYHVCQLWLSEKRQSLEHQGLKLQQSGGIPPFQPQSELYASLGFAQGNLGTFCMASLTTVDNQWIF